MKYILHSGTVVTGGKQNNIIENGAVVWENNKILAIGDEKELLNRFADADRINANGGIIFPAFINAHHHIYSAFARGLSIPNNTPNNFLAVLEGTWWNIDRHLTNAMTRYSAYMTLIECIKSGVTTVFDHHASFGEITGSLSEIAEVSTELGVRSCLCYEISDRDGEQKAKQSVLENVRFAKECENDKSGLLSALCGMHASFTISEKTMTFAREQMDNGFHIHVCEGSYDRDDCERLYHESVISRLKRHDILGEKTICGHCVYLTSEDRQILADTNTAVVHNPQSNMGNAVGVTDVLKLFNSGVTVGLGTDGFTSDMLESMKHANVLIKHENKHPSVGWNETFDMALTNNALLANRHFSGEFGELKEGANADIIVSDYKSFTPLTANNFQGHMLFGMNGRNIVTTIGNGKILMKNRELLTVDEEKVRFECQKQSKELWSILCGGE